MTDLQAGEGAPAAFDDRLLVLDFQAGHPEAFVEIHRRYAAVARQVCSRLLPNAPDAEEAFQETMIRVFQGLFRLNGRYALRPWIARIATNVCLDHIRAQARRPRTGGEDAEEREDPGDGPEDAVERLVQRDLVISVLADLPDPHRRALVLRELEGLSHRQMAEVMGITPAQAKALIHRAKSSFRRRWMERVVERGGLAGFALLPTLWLWRAAGALRRVGERIAHTGAGEAVTGAASQAATPALAERVVAAATVTALVAGTVTAGAVVSHRRAERVPRASAPAAAPAAPAPALGRPEAPLSPSALPREVRPRPEGTHRERRERAGTPSPTPEPSGTPSPATEPSPSPSPSESPTPEPPPAPPAWSGTFAVDWTSDDVCGCGPGLALVTSSSTGTLAEGLLTVEQTFEGAALDAEGDAAWSLSSSLRAELRPEAGSVVGVFTLGSGDGETHYSLTATATSVLGIPGNGAVTYVLAGTYTQVGAGEGPIPTQGWAELRISVWSDGLTAHALDVRLGR
jgi:RNA polymerase sigma-70 factor (ECF subfamily)